MAESDDGHLDSAQVVATRLREAREVSGLTQRDVAQVLGIQRTSVLAFEAGRRAVSAVEIKSLARLYERSVAWLLGEAESLDLSGEALYRAAERLSASDRDQVLKFAQFLAAPTPSNTPRNSDHDA
jgi:transcriptional regulator with XRE-family HTH domain